MDDERKNPRRLLSFDASQNPWTRFGKVFNRASGRGLGEGLDVGDHWRNRTCQYTSAVPIVSMSPFNDRKLAAIAGAQSIEIIDMSSAEQQLVKTITLDQKSTPLTIEWGQGATKSHIAMATTSGQLQIFSSITGSQISSTPKQSGGLIRAPIYSLSFSSMAGGNILAGAASDGSVRLWDLRQGLKRPASTFQRSQDIARELQFRPDLDTKFAVIYDSGMMQRWDIRKPASHEFRVNAHMQGLTLNWHASANYLATGGRDHHVNVWNMSTDSKSPEYSFNTAYAVGKVRWVPGESTISSSFVVTSGRSAATSNNRSVCYWHLRSPWVPIYCLESHTDSIVDLSVNSPSIIWSASKDKTLIQHDIRYEPLVYDNLPPAVATWASVHNIGINVHEKPTPKFNTPLSTPVPQDSHEDPNFEPDALVKTLSTSGKPSSSLPFLGSSFSLTPSPSTSGPGSVAGNVTPTGSYFTSNHGSPSGFNLPNMLSRPENLSVALNRMFAEQRLSPIIELQFLPSDGGILDKRVTELLFIPLPDMSLAEACLHNSKVADTPLNSSDLWRLMAVAISEVETTFLKSVSGHKRELAVQWFRGDPSVGQYLSEAVVDEHTNATTASINEEKSEMYNWTMDKGKSDNTWQLSGVSFNSETSMHSEDEHNSRPAPQKKARRPSALIRAASSSTRHIPKLSTDSQFTEMRQQFLNFVASRKQQWSFLAILRGIVQQAIDDGLIYTTASILLLFQRFESILDLPNTDEVIVTAIQIMRSQKLFVNAAHIMNISDAWEDHYGPPEITADVVCHYCGASLSENTAFFKAETSTGYWYCGKCKNAQKGCAFCNISVKGLGIVILGCGHRIHPDCWRTWLDLEMQDCPAGCGQAL